MQISSRTLICSVVFLDIVEYSKKPVEEQIQLKQAFNEMLTASLERIAPRDRIILDTGDGAAVTFPGDPEDALFTAISIRDSMQALPVRMGINLGPVRLVRDINKQTSIIGDGINVAQRVMSFSEPGQILVSRSFYEVVSCLSHDFANLFRHEGSRTDKHVRAHEVYSVVAETPEARRLIETASHTMANSLRAAWWSARGPLGLHRSAMVAAPLLFFVIVGTALAIRSAQEPEAPPARPARPKPAVAETAPTVPSVPPTLPRTERADPAPPAPKAAAAKPAPSPSAAVERASPRSPAREKKESARPTGAAPVEDRSVPRQSPRTTPPTTSRAATQNSALIHLAITPWGEVFVDGASRGVSPPLRSIEVSPGTHTVEIRNASFPAYIDRIDFRSGDRIRIRHRFK
jgi:hypothetical protein